MFFLYLAMSLLASTGIGFFALNNARPSSLTPPIDYAGDLDREVRESLRATIEVFSKDRDGGVFEFGAGPGAELSKSLGVGRYYGVTAREARAVELALSFARPNYTIEYVDIGPVTSFELPLNGTLTDAFEGYSKVKGDEPYDLYLVNGRFRVACVAQALLHGRASSVIVLLDHHNPRYKPVRNVTNTVDTIGNMAVLTSANATRERLVDLWDAYKHEND